MDIKGKMKADIVGFAIKRNKAHDGREAIVDIDIGVSQEHAASRFGDEFSLLAFGTMRVFPAQTDDDEDTVGFYQDVIKPNHRLVCAKHEIDLDGHRLTEQPKLIGIRTTEGKPYVIARLRIPVDVTNELITKLAQSVGKTVDVEFEPQQGTLGFTGGPEVPSRKRRARAEPESEQEAVAQ